jgi:hypothetical protein
MTGESNRRKFHCHSHSFTFTHVQNPAAAYNALSSHYQLTFLPQHRHLTPAQATKISSASANYRWLWCDNHAKVTTWFLSLPDRHEYAFFYASFINTANRSWEMSVDRSSTAKKLSPLSQLIVDCLEEESIPADMLIEVLEKYNKFIGGTKGNLKGTGLISFDNVAPGEFFCSVVGLSNVDIFVVQKCLTSSVEKQSSTT